MRFPALAPDMTSNLPEEMKENFLDQSGCAVNGGLLEILRNGTGDCDLLSEMSCAGKSIRGYHPGKRKVGLGGGSSFL